MKDDSISRQAAIEVIGSWLKTYTVSRILFNTMSYKDVLNALPSAQPEITDEQAILHLQTSGWMQTHDKQMYEMGLREQLADDSDSYNALLPSVQPEIVRCGQCKYAEVADAQDNQDGYTCQFHRGSIWFSGSYCSWGERKSDEQV